eukprot:gene4707-4958_t
MSADTSAVAALIGVMFIGGACLILTADAAAAAVPAPPSVSEAATGAQPAAQSVMQLSKPYPEVSRALVLLKNYDDVVEYLGDPNTVCTFFAASNIAVQNSLDLLKEYAGIVAANDTLQRSTFNYHIVAGKALTTADLMQLNQTSTRTNETLYIWHRNGTPWLYSRPEYPVEVKQANIKAGNCIVHIIDTAGTEPPKPSVANFAPIQDAYLQTYVDAASNVTNSTASDNSSASPAPLPAAGKSSASWTACGTATAAYVGVLAAAALL